MRHAEFERTLSAYAAAPILLNLSLIAAALVAYYSDNIGAGHALAWGVTLGGRGTASAAPGQSQRAGMLPRLLWPRLTKGVRQVLKLFGPARPLGAGVVQINLVIDLWVASFLATGSISYLYYADRVNQLLLGVVALLWARPCFRCCHARSRLVTRRRQRQPKPCC